MFWMGLIGGFDRQSFFMPPYCPGRQALPAGGEETLYSPGRLPPQGFTPGIFTNNQAITTAYNYIFYHDCLKA